MTRIVAILIAAGVLATTSSALAASRSHRSPHWTANHHRWRHVHVQPRVLEPRYAPDAFGFQTPGYGMPYSSTEERWFNQAKGNIW